MSKKEPEMINVVRTLCEEAGLSVSEGQLPDLVASYKLIAEGAESLEKLDGYEKTQIFTLINPYYKSRSSK
jgi:hypothetical protein